MSKKKKKAWAEHGLEDWDSYMAAKKEKLEDQFEAEARQEFQDATSLFAGIAIFVNGYTDPCADELKRLMMAHGGVYHHYMRSRITTHIIASNLPYSKIVMYRKSQNPLPICKPEWITDSIKAQKLLDWRPYVLYSNCTKTQPQLQFPEKSRDPLMFAATESKIKKSETVVHEDKEISNEIVSASPDNVKIDVKSDVKSEASTSHGKSSNGPLSTKNSEFLSEFYNNSRLHHLSTMGAAFKDYVNELRNKNDGTFEGLKRLKRAREHPRIANSDITNETDSDDDFFESPSTETIKNISNETVIMHIDMDCFFVSVGLINRPELRGLPVAVTHAKGNKQTSGGSLENDYSDGEYGSMSEIASCSYEARKAGVKNGMFLGQALKLCPELKTIKYDFDGYNRVSYALYDTVASYTLSIEAVSCDEMYTDITNVLVETGLKPLEFATIIRDEIREKTRCPVSTGFGCNKLQSRLATRRAKPDGQFYLDNREFQDYIGSMVVRDLPGVGYSTTQLLNKMNVHTCSDLRDISLFVLQKEFGKKTGEMLYNMCRGIDNSKLTVEHVRKSVSAEVNYGIRFDSTSEAEDFLRKLSQEVCGRLQKANTKGRSITLKLMVRAKDAPRQALKFMGHGICDNFTKSKNLIAPIDDPIIITREVITLWNQMQQPFEDIRGIGIQISRLESTRTRTGTIMNFINKSKQPDVEKSNDKEKILSSVNHNYRGTSKSEKIVPTIHSTRDPKSRGLKEFLVRKSQLFQNQRDPVIEKVSLKMSNIEEMSIDESVLAELPEEIRREILESREIINNERKSSTSIESEKNSNNDRSDSSNLNIGENADSSSTLLVRPCSMNNYDASVLRELPEEIRNEILGTKKLSALPEEKKKASNSRQTQQEKYFKHAKPSSGKSLKAKMPPMEEIDMSVLIELPEDIRNEIMNEYRAKKYDEKRQNGGDEVETVGKSDLITAERTNNPTRDKREIHEDSNVSFSQVDPDFLAALSEDMKTDVEMYCMIKKKEKLTRINKLSEASATNANSIVKNRNLTKFNKKNVRLPKTRNKITCNVVKSTRDRKNVRESSDVGRNNELVATERNSIGGRFLNGEFCVDAKIGGSLEQREEIISHHTSFVGKIAKTEEQEMVTSLVNYLFTIPRQQVKMQIQTWISNSDDVNEIDLLSLATFLSMLPKKKRLEDLHILLKTMHRCITKTGSCVWHETYRRTVYHVQRYMQIEYNSKMMLQTIKCDHCDCETSPIV